jgi:tetratricopeptide (TPR) repeat protein
MSRSINTTRRRLNLERLYQLSNDEIKEARLNKIQDELDNKKIIKAGENLSRKSKKASFQLLDPVDPEGILINVLESSDHIHYPISKRDIIEVAKRLPVNAIIGLDSITLCLGEIYQEEEFDGFGRESYDPYTGRISTGDGPVYYPPILGVYRSSNSKIFLFAYVYDKQKLKLDVIEPFLRLKMLMTFIHEVAHHDDNLRRSGRGRCFGLNESRCENYAETQEALWAKTAVIPHLQETYPEEYTRLLNWINKMGGVDISLNSLIGEYSGRIGNLYRLGFTINSAVDEMIKNVSNGKSNREVMIEFASDLHIGDHYDECMKSLETLLAKDSRDADALGIKADTLIHLEKYDEAEITAKECLTIDPSNLDAIRALCDIQRERKNWILLKQISAKGIQVSTGWQSSYFLENNLIASLHLKDYKTAREDAESLPDKRGRGEQKKRAFIALVAFVSGDADKAVQMAKEVLSQEKVVPPAKAVLKAIINKYPDKAGDSENGFAFTEYEENFLQMFGIRDLI